MSHGCGFTRPFGQSGFSLVELLVVAAILAMLMTILLPTFSHARAMAKTVKCSTNLFRIGQAAAMYSADNNYYVPRGAANGANNPVSSNFGLYRFGPKFSPYLGGPVVPFERDEDDDYLFEVFKHIPQFRCPSFHNPEYVLTYIVNGRDFEKPASLPDDEGPASRLDLLPAPPADIAYICELNPAVCRPTRWFGAYDFFYDSQVTFRRSGRPNIFECRVIRFDDRRHLGRTTIVYFDGHANSVAITPEEMPLELFFPDRK